MTQADDQPDANPPHEDDEAWLDAFTEKMGHPTEAEQAFFTRREQLGLGVGLDADGNLVRASRKDDAQET